jgi:hypothetical protein
MDQMHEVLVIRYFVEVHVITFEKRLSLNWQTSYLMMLDLCSRCTERVFGPAQWKELYSKLGVWKVSYLLVSLPFCVHIIYFCVSIEVDGILHTFSLVFCNISTKLMTCVSISLVRKMWEMLSGLCKLHDWQVGMFHKPYKLLLYIEREM